MSHAAEGRGVLRRKRGTGWITGEVIHVTGGEAL